MQVKKISSFSVRKAQCRRYYAHETEAYVGILIYMGLVNLSENYIISRRLLFVPFSQENNDALHVNGEENRSRSQKKNVET